MVLKECRTKEAVKGAEFFYPAPSIL